MLSYLKENKIAGCIAPFLILLMACSQPHLPKPHGYMRLEYPHPIYSLYKDKDIPIQFLKSNHVKVHKRKAYWANAKYKIMEAEIHITYTPIEDNLYVLLREVQKITYDHTIKADAIGETLFDNPKKKVYGTLYDLTGDAASAIQFYVTDSLHHIISGSLYFDSEPKPDSLAPAIAYIKEDIMRMIESLEWVKN